MADFGDEEYPGMVCVEAGAVAPKNAITLAAGKELAATMKLSVESSLSKI
jgi:D-hexose-6-phosphate mutarotase